MQKLKKFTQASVIFFALIILCLAALLGAACAPGQEEDDDSTWEALGVSFELQGTSDASWSWVVFKISAPTTLDKNGNVTNTDVLLHDVYVNVNVIDSNVEAVTMELQWGSATTQPENFFTLSSMRKAVLFNPDYVANEGDAPIEETDKFANYVHQWRNQWIAPFGLENLAESSSYRSLASPIYFKLELPIINRKPQSCSVIINEIVFVGEVQDKNGGTGEYVVLPVEIDARTRLGFETPSEGLKRAAALLDAQRLPNI